MTSAALSSHKNRNVRISMGSLRRAAEAAGYGAVSAWEDQPPASWRLSMAYMASAALFVTTGGVALAWLAF